MTYENRVCSRFQTQVIYTAVSGAFRLEDFPCIIVDFDLICSNCSVFNRFISPYCKLLFSFMID